ncbi:MAG: DUF4097 family beta strand repeat-containing protein [Candidatus Tyrphobacter sp.]
MTPRLLLPLALFATLAAGCASQRAYATSLGSLKPHERMIVRIARGTVSAYAPRIGEPSDRFTVEAFARGSSMPAAPEIRPIANGIEVLAPALGSLIVRVPKGVDLEVVSGGGDVNVTDISGSARVSLVSGTATMMLPAYGEASVARAGSVDVKIGAQSWPGMLRFVNAGGDIDLSIEENAAFRVHLHTDDGTIFTDFNLRGTSSGRSETIDGSVNGGAASGIDVECRRGAIRLLRLAPQI